MLSLLNNTSCRTFLSVPLPCILFNDERYSVDSLAHSSSPCQRFYAMITQTEPTSFHPARSEGPAALQHCLTSGSFCPTPIKPLKRQAALLFTPAAHQVRNGSGKSSPLGCLVQDKGGLRRVIVRPQGEDAGGNRGGLT